ncbi:unnamed protein product, partial [Scytosiphon promiscuus]
RTSGPGISGADAAAAASAATVFGGGGGGGTTTRRQSWGGSTPSTVATLRHKAEMSSPVLRDASGGGSGGSGVSVQDGDGGGGGGGGGSSAPGYSLFSAPSSGLTATKTWAAKVAPPMSSAPGAGGRPGR